jgi:hypothetical protein
MSRRSAYFVTGVPTRSASVSTAFRFADLAIRSADIGSESEVFLRTIRIVRNDLFEVERLVAVGSVRTKLAYTPGRLPWIRSAIENTTSALEEIGKWVDCGDVGQNSNILDQSQKLRYILNDRERLADRKSELMACHQQLSNVLSFLNRLEDLPTSKELPTYQDTTYFDDIVSRHKRIVSQHQLEDTTIRVMKDNNAQTTWRDAADRTGPINKTSLHPEAFYTQDIWTTDPVKSASQLLGGYKETKSSCSELGYNNFDKGYPSSPSLPNSPPPTYASAGQQRPRSQTSQGDIKQRFDTDCLRHKSSWLSMRKAPDDVSTTPLVQKDTWAYMHPGRHQPIAELAGDYSMSGTNSDGPVNPHAFHSTMPALAPGSNVVHDKKTETLSELLGDTSLAIELPGSVPIHSSSHSARLSRDLSQLPSQRSHATQNSNGYQTSLSELPATPTPRPIFSHTVSEPIAISNELSNPLPALELDSESSRTYVPLNTQRQTATSRPWSVSATSSDPWPPTRSTVSLHSSPRIPPTTVQSSIERDRPISSQATQVPYASNNTTSARMRRQRHMLDLLGSIDR